MIESVTHHIADEEGDWFPRVRAALGRRQLADLGVELIDAKKAAPRHLAQPGALKKVADAPLS